MIPSCSHSLLSNYRTCSPTYIQIVKLILSQSNGRFNALYWPGRTIFPYGAPNGTDARITACLSKCDTSTDPFFWSPAGHNLAKLKGKKGNTHELFHSTSENGVCYLGTFRCAEAGQYTAEEFGRLNNDVRPTIDQPDLNIILNVTQGSRKYCEAIFLKTIPIQDVFSLRQEYRTCDVHERKVESRIRTPPV